MAAKKQTPGPQRIMLDFHHHEGLGGELDEAIRNDLSVVKQSGRCLWTASDETATIERLTTEDWKTFGRHTPYRLADFFDLPVEGEVDIEGLSVDGDYLWICGSHSLKRKKPDPDETGVEEALERLTRVECEPNRYLLGRIPLVRETEDGVHALARSAPPDGGGPGRRAGRLKMDGKGSNALSKALRKDEHLGRFMAIPSKDNGFDVEGISARGDRVFLGMRGPVLRGWAVLLELEVTEKGSVGKAAGLKLRRIGPDGERYRKHFLDLDGLGIRELSLEGDDLLILAGPTMDLDGPVVLYRWHDAWNQREETVIPRTRLERVMDIPYGAGFDHAEGATLFDRPGEPPAVLVVYDNPGRERLDADGAGVAADLFPLPPRRPRIPAMS
ncbi:DUF3616 domain-containing protein [Skermanella rosea]|uniref:DUF3616 domain-containing protein n=1 Tax=Skermanella rosea TaxID=1817965 RepID=UPI001933ECFE|nr:DUF3616 domain-containing protein [Skermanella rosea]UEM04346.1 DUF3616 domain-containing protein [Skermanella rosea]